MEAFAHPKFSNKEGSNLSCLGFFKVNNKISPSKNIGNNLLVWGLDSTNSNAFKRCIKVHGWSTVPDFPVYPIVLPSHSDGCFMTSNKRFKELAKIITAQKSKVLLYVYK